jgi:hypothetical protein
MSKLYTAVVEENPMTGYEPFHQQQYLNLETFRKRDVGVKIPLWFVQEGDTLLVRTVANSGKVKQFHLLKLLILEPVGRKI